jgi:transcriptional regulator with XRE-family HTH domain
MSTAQSTRVEHVGREIERRRKALGMDVAPFAREAGVSRTTLAAIEAGTVDPRDKSLAKILRALDQLEDEGGVAPRSEAIETIEFTVEGDFGVKVTVRGPIRDRGELEQSVANIIRSIREGRDDQN